MFKCYKDLWVEKKNLSSKVEGIAAKKDELEKVVADLEAMLKELEFRLEKYKL